ncbi:Structural maintenance of chromosomes protein 5 [Podila clonocystis]|nr:Structural maintenance of chromosomes protein 5 [Podila clonocystis]
MEFVRAKQERHQKRPREEDDEDEAESTREMTVPRNRLSSNSASGATTMDKTEHLNLNNLQLLGRAKEISEFVKHGADKGWIEIVLCNKSGPNVVIKRHINKKNNISIWKINGENKTQKEVLKKVQSFNIQVDNLCQFLPQDRVSEFAQMTPQELLRETQRAVGGDEMLKNHDKMIELWNEHKTISETMKSDLDAIDTNEKRNAVIEKDVLRFQQREAVLKKLKLLAVWVLYAKYGVAKDEYNAIKESRRECFGMVQQIQSEVEPLKKKRRQMEQKLKTATDHRAKLEQHYQKALHSMKSKGALIEAANELAQVARDIKDKIDNLQLAQEDIVRDSKKAGASLSDKRRRLVALDDIRNRRLDQLRETESDVYDAVIWLRQNRALFQKHVFEPVCLEINIKNMKYVDAIENVLNSQLKTFVCQTREDYNILTREVLDKLKLRVNIIAPRPSELDLGSYRPPASKEDLHQLGFECFVLDAVDGPAPLLAALCSKASVHAVPVSESQNLNLRAVRESRLFRKFSTLQDAYTVSYSKYSGEPIQTSTSLRRARLLTASVDQQERDRLIREVDTLQSVQQESEDKVRRLTAEENDYRRQYQESLEQKDSVANKRKDLMQQLKKIEKQRIELDQLRSDLAKKEREPSSEEQEGRIHDQLQAQATKRCRLALEYVELAKESSRHFSMLMVATLIRLQVHAELQTTEGQSHEKERQLKEIETQSAEVNKQYEEVKIRAKEMLDKAKEEFNTLDPEDVPEFHEVGKGLSLDDLEDMMAREKARSEMHFSTNKSVIEKYEQRQSEIKSTRSKVESKEKRLVKLMLDIEAIRSPWYESVTALIEKISKGFSESFGKIGCAGEVRLGEHEDYDKWCIEIMVKFRDAEKLQKLTGQRQSGGERSVSTIMYLMALQSLSTVSFRVVDEINQGMDPRNERLVHTQLVEKACARGTAQYFLITPKLLPNLDYHERMKVLCIYNGEWLDDGVLKWSKYLDNQKRAKIES